VRRGHPFEQKVTLSYQGSGFVQVECSECGLIYDRPPTGEERQAYNYIFKLEITI